MIKSKLPEGSSTTVYQNGPFVDLCRGPHIANTGRVKAFTTTKNSASLWLGKQGNDPLQRGAVHVVRLEGGGVRPQPKLLLSK